MDNEIFGKSRVQVAGDDPCYPPDEPLLVALAGVAGPLVATLQGLADDSGCRLFQPVDGASGAHVLWGHAADLGRLRSRLTAEEGLGFVREALEESLGRHAASPTLPPQTEETHRLTEVAGDPDVPEGTTLRVSREFLFDAAHNLPRYNGKCERLHGHTFRIRITVDAPLDTWSGMAFDFHDLKRVIQTRIVDVLDHSYMNEVIPNPSAEYLAIWIWGRLEDLPLHDIKVWETPTCCVTYKGPPNS